MAGIDVNSVADMAKKNQSATAAKDAQTGQVLNNYVSSPSTGFSLYGTGEERANQAANLSQVGALSGQNLYQTGAESQQYDARLQARLNQADPVSQYMMGQRNRNMANVARAYGGKGIAGGVAAAGMNSAQNAADSDINSQLYKNSVTNDTALASWVKRNQKLAGEALSMGSDQGLASQIDTSAGSGITVICSELHRQGIMDDETRAADELFGLVLMEEDPYAFIGYHVWAKYVARGMSKSKLLTKLVAGPGLLWASHMKGEKTFIGAAIMKVGLFICRPIGKAVMFFENLGATYGH